MSGNRRRLATVVGGVALVFVAAGCTPGEGGSWAATGRMSEARVAHTATLLTSSGRVLVTGGIGPSGALRSVERWDPSTGKWIPLAPMRSARSDHTATELGDGRVLVTGGASQATAEIYNRTTDTWTLTTAMNVARSGHGAVRLTNGRVLVAGGGVGNGSGGGEYFDPGTGQWVQTGPLPPHAQDPDGSGDEYSITGTSFDGLVALSSGGALALLSWETIHLPDCPGACSSSFTSAALFEYSSSTNGWSERPPMVNQRAASTVTKLSNGRVLAAGGFTGGMFGDDCATGEADVYDPPTRAWFDRGPLDQERMHHAATLLVDGRVLVSGGFDAGCDSDSHTLAGAELYDPESLGFTPAAPMAQVRKGHRSVRLKDGRVLVMGGTNQSNVSLASAEVYTAS